MNFGQLTHNFHSYVQQHIRNLENNNKFKRQILSAEFNTNCLNEFLLLKYTLSVRVSVCVTPIISFHVRGDAEKLLV